MVRIVDPSFPSSPYGTSEPASTGHGEGPQQLREYYSNPATVTTNWPIILEYYPTDGTITKNIEPLITYERYTRLEGPAMALLLLLALAAPAIATGRRRERGFASPRHGGAAARADPAVRVRLPLRHTRIRPARGNGGLRR